MEKVYLLFVQDVVSISIMYPKEHVHVPFKHAAFANVQFAVAVQAIPKSSEGVAVDK